MSAKKLICILLCVFMAAVFFGCGADKPETEQSTTGAAEEPAGNGVNLIEKLNSLAATDVELGIAGKYNAFADIADGKTDPDLTGRWITADGSSIYTYNEDGTSTAEIEGMGLSEVKYTCIEANGRKIICEESEMIGDVEEGTTTLTFTAYSIENDALYMVPVENVNPDFSSSQNALIVFYRADENGKIDAALSANPVDINVLNGKWSCEKGEVTIENGVLTYGESSYNLSFDGKGQLVAEKDGESTTYSFNISQLKQYEGEEGEADSQATATTCFGIYYTGADENDKPNLLPLLSDWKAEFDWDSYYYNASFELEQ